MAKKYEMYLVKLSPYRPLLVVSTESGQAIDSYRDKVIPARAQNLLAAFDVEWAAGRVEVENYGTVASVRADLSVCPV